MRWLKNVNRIYVDAYKNYGLGHLIRTQTIAEGLGAFETNINKFLAKRSEVSIIDSYRAYYRHYENISKLSRISVFLDDFNRITYPKGILINMAFNAKKIVKQKNTLNLLGIDYVPIRKEFLEVKSADKKHILLILGGLDVKGYSHEIEKLPFDFLVVTANKEIAKKCKNVLFNPSAKDLARAFADSLLAVSAAGMTLYELNYLQIPTIAIKVAKNQTGVYEFQKRGFIKDVFEKVNINDIKKSIEWHLNNYDMVLNRYTHKLIDGYGVKRIIEAIKKG